MPRPERRYGNELGISLRKPGPHQTHENELLTAKRTRVLKHDRSRIYGCDGVAANPLDFLCGGEEGGRAEARR